MIDSVSAAEVHFRVRTHERRNSARLRRSRLRWTLARCLAPCQK